jgi:Ni/Co efflux regulator RcnB
VKRLIPIVLLVASLLLSVDVLAQAGISQKQQEKILAKKGKEDKKAKVKAEKDGRKRHLSIQDKETRKRLKRHNRRADKKGSGSHRDNGGIRLFRRKR